MINVHSSFARPVSLSLSACSIDQYKMEDMLGTAQLTLPVKMERQYIPVKHHKHDPLLPGAKTSKQGIHERNMSNLCHIK